ncbi:MAG TPA: SUMF1/EgtB/PvdO family nonheme iron enzyme, partial [Opitutales bacterium]|nr:SUMF1/EgtB/PvdO family nonheme iron enzyme [Opitutales bacterium]
SEMEERLPAYYTLWDLGQVYKSGKHAPYCNWKANGYRLPTEAEWEKAARGGLTGKRFPWGGNTIDHTHANYLSGMKDILPYDVNPTDGNHPDYITADGSPYINPVNAFAPNGYGLYNMAGNVAEFCWDLMDSNCRYYSISPLSNPRGPDVTTTLRVFRGGSWHVVSGLCTCSAHGQGDRPDYNGSDVGLGFRVVISGQK